MPRTSGLEPARHSSIGASSQRPATLGAPTSFVCSASLLRPLQARFADLAAHEGEAERILRQRANKARVIAVTLPSGPRGPHLDLAVGARRHYPWSMGFVMDTDTNGGRDRRSCRRVNGSMQRHVNWALIPTRDPAEKKADFMDTTTRSFGAPRLARRGAALIAIVALATIGAVVWPFGEGDSTPGHRSGSAAPPTSVASPASSTPAAGDPSTAPAQRANPAAATPQPSTSPPVLQDGRHPVYLTDIDVPGSTVEFDLLQYLATNEEREAYEHSHPHDGEDYSESPFRNDNPRLRRLPVMPDLAVLVQQTGPEGCDGEHMMDFAAFSENLRGRSHEIGHLGTNPFWLVVHDGTVIGLHELPCAG
jgi:hypothetical protein